VNTYKNRIEYNIPMYGEQESLGDWVCIKVSDYEIKLIFKNAELK